MAQSLDRLLDHELIAKLKPLAITVVADLVGALEADHASIGRLLDLDEGLRTRLHVQHLPGARGSDRFELRCSYSILEKLDCPSAARPAA